MVPLVPILTWNKRRLLEAVSPKSSFQGLKLQLAGAGEPADFLPMPHLA
jgi:hypothetical protein